MFPNSLHGSRAEHFCGAQSVSDIIAYGTVYRSHRLFGLQSSSHKMIYRYCYGTLIVDDLSLPCPGREGSFKEIPYFGKSSMGLEFLLCCLITLCNLHSYIYVHVAHTQPCSAVNKKEWLRIETVVARKSHRVSDPSHIWPKLVIMKVAQAILVLNMVCAVLRDDIQHTTLSLRLSVHSQCLNDGVFTLTTAFRGTSRISQRKLKPSGTGGIVGFLTRQNSPLVDQLANWPVPTADVTTVLCRCAPLFCICLLSCGHRHGLPRVSFAHAPVGRF